MATQRPMVAGYVDQPVKEHLARLKRDLGSTESKLVEYLVTRGLPELDQAAKGAGERPILIGISHPPRKPQSR